MITDEDKNKIDELVEWVSNGITISLCSACGGNGEVCDRCWCPNSYDLARIILSYPDLALIDRGERILPQLVYITEKNRENELECARHSQIEMLESGYNHRIIPLAKTIQEITK